MKKRNKYKKNKININYDRVRNLNVTDFDALYEDIVLTYNGVRPSDNEYINYICTIGNGGGLREFLTDIETYYDVMLDFNAERIFKKEAIEFINILKEHIGEHVTDINDIINKAFNPNSSLNIELSNHDISKYIIIVKGMFLFQMRQYDPNCIYHDYLYIINRYNHIIHNTNMETSYGYNCNLKETPIVDLADYLDSFKMLPVTRRENASMTDHPYNY